MNLLPDTCSTREAAKFLNVALSTVQIWVESGFLQAWKTPGGHRRVTLASIDNLLKMGMAPPIPEVPTTLRLLVVEDDPDLRGIYAGYVQAWGLPIKLTLATDGYEGLLQAGIERPHLLITDLRMPGMDGLRLIRVLRADAVMAATEIIVVSGLSQAEIETRGGLPEDIRLLGKPISFDTLREIITQRITKLGIVIPSPSHPPEVASS